MFKRVRSQLGKLRADEDHAVRITVVLLAFVVVSAVVPAIVILAVPHRHWTEFPEWWSATSTAFAFAAAAVAALLAFGTSRRELDRDEEREQDKRRAQADLVAAWVEGFVIYPVTLDGRAGYQMSMKRALVRNASELPVQRAIVVLDLVGRSAGQLRVADGLVRRTTEVVPPAGQGIELKLTVDEFELINPEIETFIADGFQLWQISLVAELMFVDVAGRHWFRRRDGRLDELPEAVAEMREHGGY